MAILRCKFFCCILANECPSASNLQFNYHSNVAFTFLEVYATVKGWVFRHFDLVQGMTDLNRNKFRFEKINFL